jgi:multiple sugar transport system ATP-binding protein
MATVTIEKISKNFGETLAVDDVSFHIEDGEFVVLLGPSGCGKTTTLNMIAGLEKPTSGHISIGGERVEHVPPDKRDIAMVFQSIALYPHMSVSQNIGFPLRMARVPTAERAERVQSAANLLRIGDLLHRKPHELSGGQRQRVALGRAVVRDPAVFLFDEPLSSLDAKLRVEMRVELKKLHERLGATFIYVTHDQVEAMTMADRVFVMDLGDLLQVGSPDEIYRLPVNIMVAGFLGNPGMNLITGRLNNEGDRLQFEGNGLVFELPNQFSSGATPGDSVTLGIRPESVLVGSGPNGASVSGDIFATEPVGSDLFLDILFGKENDGSHLFKVRAQPELKVQAGEQVQLNLPYDKLYLFDNSGNRIYPV